MNRDDIRQVERRVKRYWYTDGIAEISSGGMFMLLGLYFGLQAFFGESSPVSIILQVSMVLLMLGGIFGVRWLVNALKSRLTYPRTGYVEYRVHEKDSKIRRYAVIAVAAIISVASIVLADAIRDLDSIVLISGLLVGTIFIALRGRSSGLLRFYALGGLALLLGFALSISGLSQAYNLAVFYGLMGMAIVVSGGMVMRRYLHENPMPEELDRER